MSFAGRHVLITGGSMGIGLAVARRLAADGARLTLAARGLPALEAARAALPPPSAGAHGVLPLDVGDRAAWRAWQAAQAAQGEPLHGLVLSAGVYGPIGPLGSADLDLDALEDALRINLLGVVYALHHARDALVAAGGRVVVMAGGGAASAFPNFDAYAASKAAVVRLVENVALEWAATGVTVNAVAPGFVRTRLHDQTLAAGPERVGADFFARTEHVVAGGGDDATLAADLTAWLLHPGSPPVSGRLLSARWDPWQDPAFPSRLLAEADLATLRRVDDVFVRAVPPEARG